MIAAALVAAMAVVGPAASATPDGAPTRRVETDQPIIALTLDDGYRVDPRVLDLLQTWGLRGTAFIVGEVARNNPGLIRRLVQMRWEVCSHTWTHRNLTGLSDYEIYREMSRAMKEVNEVSGQRCPYFRPPSGAVDSRVIATANQLGLKIINWDSSLSDSTTAKTDPRVQVSLAFKYLRRGSILLGHFGSVNSYEVLKEVLTATLGAGYRVGTVTELLQAAGEWVPATPPGPSLRPVAATTRTVAAKPAVDDLPAPVLNDTKKVSNTVGFVRLAGSLAVFFVVLLAFRARDGRQRLRQAKQRQLARQRRREHTSQR